MFKKDKYNNLIRHKIIKQKYFNVGQESKATNKYICDYLLCSRKGVELFDNIKIKINFIKIFIMFRSFYDKNPKKQLNILFCSTSKVYGGILKNAALDCGMPYRIHRWLGGTITGFIKLEQKPDFLFIPDVKNNSIIIKEAKIMGIPIIGIVNSSSTFKIDYPIFGNDTNVRIVLRITHLISSLITLVKSRPWLNHTTKK